MKFANSNMLWFLATITPLLMAFFWWSSARRRQLISQFVQSRLLASLTVGVSARRQQIKNSLLVATVGLLFLALARPHWSYDWQDASQQGLDIVVAVDTSRSMLAADLTPDRLTRTKLAIRDLLLKARTDRLGLVPFAGTAFIQCPLTVDQEAFQQNVNILDVDIIPEGGSDVGAAIDTAASAFEVGEGTFHVIVLFSDGEDHNDRAVKAAEAAAKKGIRIFTVGVGTPGGELLQVKDARGTKSFLRDGENNVIKSRLNEALLQEIAGAGGGFYLPLGGPDTIDTLYERGLAPLPRGELAAAKIKRPIDRFQWPLGLAMLLLVIELFVPERKRVTRDDVKAAAPKPFWQAAILLLLATGTAMGSPRSARRAYDKGDFSTSLEQYRQLLKKGSTDSRLQYNAGAAAYQAGNFDDAASYFTEAQTAGDLKLMQQAYYNRGNALYRQGEASLKEDQEAAMERWQKAVEDYESALSLKLDEVTNQMARHNKEFVEKKLALMKKQQNQSSKKDSKGNKPKDKTKGDQGPQQPGQQNQPQDQGNPQQNSDSGEPQKQGDKDGEDKKQQAGGNDQQQQQQGNDGQDQKQPNDPNQQMAAYGQMTGEQARQLLEAQRGEERALLFLPQNRTNRIRDPRKNW